MDNVMNESNDKSPQRSQSPRLTQNTRLAQSSQLPALMTSAVAAGFPSPADDHAEDRLDLNTLLIKHPAATFFVRVSGDSMLERGIHDGDLLVVDRSLEASDGSVVIAIIDSELTVKEFRRRNGRVSLVPANTACPPVPLAADNETHIWGVATCVIHSL